MIFLCNFGFVKNQYYNGEDHVNGRLYHYNLLLGRRIDKKLGNKQKLRKRGFNPALSDAEMITMEVVAEFLSIDTDKGAWTYFSTHWRHLFPALGSRANFAKHASNLWAIKQLIQKLLATNLGAFSDLLHLSDGFPVPICHFRRANFSRIFAGDYL